RSNAPDILVQQRFPKAAPTRWKYNSILVKVVSAVKNDLDELFRSTMENPTEWDGESRACARGFCHTLNEFNY
ncbi:hypothetical protein ILUMI_16735, partial [Ignelater luminosus]